MLRNKTTPRRVALLIENASDIDRAILRGIARYARARDPWILVQRTRAAAPLRAAHGVIVRSGAAAKAVRLGGLRVPCVVILPPPAAGARLPAHAARIYADGAAAGRLAARHALAVGFASFAFAPWPAAELWSDERLDGFASELAAAGKSCRTLPRGRAPLARALRALSPGTFVLAANDLRGREVLQICQETGLAVPERLAVMGIDNDSAVCALTAPPLASVAMDGESAGLEAARILDALMRGRRPRKSAGFRYPPEEIVMRASAERRGAPNELAARARAFIDARRGLDVRVNEVAAALGVTAQWIERRFRAAYGMTLKHGIARARDAEIERLVTTTDLPFAEISNRCGFSSPSHFSALYRRTHGLTPTAARTPSPTP